MLGTGLFKTFFGWGLSEYAPYVIYGFAFLIAFLALFYRSEIGILFIAFFLPVYTVRQNNQIGPSPCKRHSRHPYRCDACRIAISSQRRSGTARRLVATFNTDFFIYDLFSV
jgi:hypothetical protein